VDLGTTFVAAARSGSSQVEMVTLGDRSVVMPSAVYVAEDGAVVVGEAADRRAVNSPERVAWQFKRRLGDPTPVRLGDAAYSATELLGIVLGDVLARVAEVEGGPPEQVVLTHPANWGPFRRGVFAEVPRLAGVADAVTITEPEAAATHYVAAERLAVGKTVAVYDLGGGTFDATVVRKEPGGVRILGTPEGVERLGGIDFDQALYDFVSFSSDGALDDLDSRDPKTAIALTRLRRDCVLAKESLSVDTEFLLPVFLPGRQFDVRITRVGFEDLIRAQIESTITALSRTLQSSGVTAEELDAVLLVGGSSRIPLVAQMVSERLDRPVLVDTHPKYVVALGAATLTQDETTSTSDAVTLSKHDAPLAVPVPPLPPDPQTSNGRRAAKSHPPWARIAAATTLLGCLALVGWLLASTAAPNTPPRPQQASPRDNPLLPAVLTRTHHVDFPTGVRYTALPDQTSILVLQGRSLRLLDVATLATQWNTTLPKVGTTLWPLSDNVMCVETSNTECIPVNVAAEVVEPPIQYPGPARATFTLDGGTSIGQLDETGRLNVLDLQTHSVRSAPAITWPKPSGLTLIAERGNDVYIVGNEEAPSPVMTVVDVQTMTVTTHPWPRRVKTSNPPGVEFMRVSLDGKSLYTLASVASPGELRVYDTATMSLQRTFPQNTSLRWTIGQSPDGHYLYLRTNDGEVRVIDAVSGQQVSAGHTTTPSGGFLFAIDQGRQLIAGTQDGYDLFDTSAFTQAPKH
jgi:actin-like ATPase involved in cell morphogenesis